MPTLNEYFDKIFCINLAKRPDRWEHAIDQCKKHDLTIERFEAHEHFINGKPHGVSGCTSSHRAILERIATSEWKRVLVLEDDFEFRFDDSQKKFSEMIGDVPVDWEILYLGAHYAGKPLARITPHVIHAGRMNGTHAYAVTRAFAREKAPHCRNGPIDSIYGNWALEKRYYCLQPRLVVQIKGYSDVEEKTTNNIGVGTSSRHESMV